MSKAKKVNQEAILKQIAQLQELLELDKKKTSGRAFAISIV